MGLTAVGILAVISTALPAAADTRTKTGSINNADPTMPVVFIDGAADTCTGQGASPVHYAVVPFTAAADGPHRFILTSDPASFASMYLYEGNFDPTNGFENCVAADNSGDTPAGKIIIEYAATARTEYFVVVFDDTFDQLGGDFTVVINAAVGPAIGPGKRFVRMPDRINCAEARAIATWKPRAVRVESAVFRANKNHKIVAEVTRIVPGRKVVLHGIPPAATRLIGVLTLRSGAKVQVRRDYVRC